MTAIRDLETRVGQEVGISPWVEITQERIDTARLGAPEIVPLA